MRHIFKIFEHSTLYNKNFIIVSSIKVFFIFYYNINIINKDKREQEKQS